MAVIIIILLLLLFRMTTGAQQALRRIMELYAGTTRFALACNTSSKIIEPIQSRCAILRYTRLSPGDLLKVLVQTATKEGVQYDPEGLNALLFVADGDMRQALNGLQASAALGFVSESAVLKVCDEPHPNVMETVLRACQEGHLDKAIDCLEPLCRLGHAPVDLITSMFRVAKGLPTGTLPEALQMEYLREIGNCHVRILDGCPTRLQLYGLLARLSMITV